MRIIGRLPHPQLQITVFSNDGRFPVQFEYRGQTQQYRFRQGPEMANFGDVKRVIDAEFVAEVLRLFQQMQTAQARLVRTYLSEEGPAENELPNII